MIMVLVLLQPNLVGAGQWVNTERLWDDERLQANESFTWTGGHDREGRASGEGVLQWYINGKQDHRYEGNMAKGRVTGKGICFFANGNRYEGDWSEDRRTGKGIFTWANGDRYEGDFVKDQRTGKGTMTYANGDRYEGEWVNGKRSGRGSMAYINGNWYEGAWEEDKKNGNGSMILASGSRQEGRWIQGSYAGPAKSPVSFLLIFISLAGGALWALADAMRDGKLSWWRLLKNTGLYVLCALLSAVMAVTSEVMGQFLFGWTYVGSGWNNTVALFAAIGICGAVVDGGKNKWRYSWRRMGYFLSLYGLFTLLLFMVWYVCLFFFTFFIFSLGR